ncbi:MAG: fumarylacetoacetate hydrolase family protein [Micrococcaceae bacterium]|nr:fumarylacetoacetate hydrolase family protein [Micrococcaceae bacterium]
MKFARIGDPGAERPIVLDDEGRAFDISGTFTDIDGAFLSGGGIDTVREGLAAGSYPALGWSLAEGEAFTAAPTGERIGSPIARPGNVICIGMNYAAHARESGAEPPSIPVVFLKPANTVTGPFDPAPIPPLARKYDWEVELGIVIGAHARYLATPEAAKDVVSGLLIANDLSEREYQIPGAAGQWTKGKSLPQSTPLGPFLVPADEIDGHDLGCRSWINGEVRQDSSTRDFIFDIPAMVHHVSQYMVLEPGDVILTGTPEGVALSGRFPYLAEGDVGEFEIQHLGRQRQEFFREQVNA